MTTPEGRQHEKAQTETEEGREHVQRLPGGPSRDRPPTEAQSMGQLLQDLSHDTSHLVRQEIQLAQVELKQKAKLAGLGAGLLAAAAILGLGVLGAGTAFLITVIAVVLPVWLAALAVTVFYALLVTVLALAGRRELRRATPVMPEQTVETLKEDAEWARTQTRSART